MTDIYSTIDTEKIVQAAYKTLVELSNVPERQLGELSGRLAACKLLLSNALSSMPKPTEMELSWFDHQMQDPKFKALFDIELAKYLAEHSVSYEKGWTDACSRVSDSISVMSMTPDRPTREDMQTAAMAVIRARRVVTEVSRSCPDVSEKDE